MEASTRWKRGRYLLTWGLLAGAQLLTLQSIAVLQQGGGVAGELAVYGLGLLLLQGMKLVPTLGRLRDLGRPPDDALWTFVPVMNIALWTWMLWRTPSDARWEARRRQWEGRLQALPAWGFGIRRLGRVLPGAAGAAVVLVVGELSMAEMLRWMVALDASGRAGLSQVAMVGAGVALLYGLSTWVKRARVGPGAWGPAWLAVPFVLLWMALGASVDADAAGTTGMLVFSGMVLGLTMSVMAIAWGLALSILLPALDRDAGRPVVSGVLAAVVAASIGRTVVVAVGMQLVIPGVWFAVSWSLAEISAARAPTVGPFRASADAVSDRRGTVLKVLLVYGLASAAGTVVTLPLVGPAVWQAAMLGTTVLPSGAALVDALVAAPIGLLCAAALREVADDAGLHRTDAEAVGA